MDRVIGLDIGEKYIGIAISDETFTIAQSLCTVERTSNKEAYEKIHEILEKYNVKKVVAGLPKNMNNTIGPTGQMVMKFAEKLKNKFRIELVYVDERMTTLMADRILIESSVRRENRKKYVDKIAASFILQSYIDSIRNKEDYGKNSILWWIG